MKFKEWCGEGCANGESEYELNAAIFHVGEKQEFGHYLVFIKNKNFAKKKEKQEKEEKTEEWKEEEEGGGGEWICFDDQNVQLYSKSSFSQYFYLYSSTNLYMLFYQKLSF